jgi:hypothetical protein
MRLDYITLEITEKAGVGLQVRPLSEQWEFVYECNDFGDVLSAVLNYRMKMIENKGLKIDPRVKSRHYFDSEDFEKLEELVSMHNQLAEIKRTFEDRDLISI